MKYGLNCGSGQRPFHSTSEIEWLNVDVQDTHDPDFVFDLKEPWTIHNWANHFDYVVWHHCWEHEGCGDTQHFQKESYRALKPGGSMLVFVPDMRALAQGWLMGRIDTQIYMTNIYGAYQGSEHDRHKWGYDFKSLVSSLDPTWRSVVPFDGRLIQGANIAIAWWILGMEAIK